MAKDFTSQQVVDGYDQHIRKLIPGYEVVHQQILAVLKTYLPKRAHLLVVGCGTGYELRYLLEAFPDCSFTATDLSTTMLDKAQATIQDLNVEHRVRFVLGDVSELQDTASFDAALSILVTHFIPFEQKDSFLLAIQKKLKQEGIFITFDLIQIMTQKEKDTLKYICEMNGLTSDQTAAMLNRLENDFFPLSEKQAEESLIKAGFQEVKRFTQILCYQGLIAKLIKE